MTNDRKNNEDKRYDNGRPLTEDKGIPTVDKAPKMPDVNPPKDEKKNVEQ